MTKFSNWRTTGAQLAHQIALKVRRFAPVRQLRQSLIGTATGVAQRTPARGLHWKAPPKQKPTRQKNGRRPPSGPPADRWALSFAQRPVGGRCVADHPQRSAPSTSPAGYAWRDIFTLRQNGELLAPEPRAAVQCGLVCRRVVAAADLLPNKRGSLAGE